MLLIFLILVAVGAAAYLYFTPELAYYVYLFFYSGYSKLKRAMPKDLRDKFDRWF